MEDTRTRPILQINDVTASIKKVRDTLSYRLSTKGDGIAVSSHEVLGIVTEEYHELVKAVQDNDTEAQYHELVDIAVACLLGLASIENGGMDW